MRLDDNNGNVGVQQRGEYEALKMKRIEMLSPTIPGLSHVTELN